MNSNSFISYLWHEATSKLTLINKILLGIFVISLFIPLPNGTIELNNIVIILWCLYLVTIMAGAIFGAIFLVYNYLDFKSDVDSDQNYILYLYLFLMLVPIVSLLMYYGFHIITALQVASFAPTILTIIIIILNKIKKIFIQK